MTSNRRSLYALLATAVVVVAVTLTSLPRDVTFTTDDLSARAAVFDETMTPMTVVMHRSSTCECCGAHREYLEQAGFTVEEKIYDASNVSDVKRDRGIPRALWSCHTTIVDGYAVEGHVPVDVIKALLVEQPEADGLALPAMPSGSPGMGGNKTSVWTFSLFENGTQGHTFAQM